MKQIIFSLLLLSLGACSKEQEQEVIQCGEDMMPPSAEFIKEWEQKQQGKASKPVPQPRQNVRSQPVEKKKAPQPPTPRVAATPQTVSPSPNPPTQIQLSDMFAPLSGRSVVWSYNPNKYIPRTVIGCPQNRIDSFCMGRDYRVIQKVFGEPNHATHDRWTFNGLKVKYLAGGGRHSVVHIGFLNGKVCRVTTDL